MDVIALAQAGFDETVAPLGTALPEHQIERLWKMVEVTILWFDGDAAGQKAAVRAAMRALPLLRPVHSMDFATLPPEHGRASCRERVCQYGYTSVGAASTEKTQTT